MVNNVLCPVVLHYPSVIRAKCTRLDHIYLAVLWDQRRRVCACDKNV